MPEPRERELNTRLRRADWRFLLPTPRPRRAACRAGDALVDSVAAIAGEVVAPGPGADCDLAVATDPDRRTLAGIAEALRPGGVCYTEWHGVLRSRGQVERLLREAGFAHVTCYRPWPDLAPLYWIPLGAPGAMAYVRARQRLRGGRVRRMITQAGVRARNLLTGRPSRAPLCAVALPAAADLDGSPGPAKWLLDGWPEWEVGATPERLSILLVTGGPRTVSKVVLLAFGEPNPTPLLAVKAPRVSAAHGGIRREWEALVTLRQRRPTAIPGVPRALSCREFDQVPVMSETALTGRPLERLLNRGNLRGWSMKAADWLARLAEPERVRPAAYWRDAIVLPTLSRFTEAFGSVADRDLLRETEVILDTITELPSVPEQRDFGPWNLLATPDGDLAVLDWESAEMEGLPALDLLYFLGYASFAVEGAQMRDSRLAAYRRSLDPSTATGAVCRDALRRYLDSLGLGPDRMPPLRVLVWLIHALSEYRHAAADAGATPPSSMLAGSLFLGLWAEEVRHVSRS
jgi:hypothetical protein